MGGGGKLWIWSTPRSSSTVMERALRGGSSTWGYHEPSLDAYYLGPERKIGTFDEEPEWLKENEEKTFAAVRKMIDDAVAKEPFENFVVKEMTYYYDLDATGDHSASLPASFGDFFVLLLVRHPALVAESYLRGNYGNSFEECELGFAAYFGIYDFVLSRGVPYAVVDADTFMQDPGTMLEKICAKAGLPYDPAAMLKWTANDPRPDWHRAIKVFPGFYGSVVNSDGFYDKPAPNATRAYSTLPDWLKGYVDRAMPIYERIKGDPNLL